jgi:hypothetical protein
LKEVHFFTGGAEMKFNSFAKVLFDLVMLVLLAAVYCAQPTGIPVHEYIGLAIYLFFIVHLLYNYTWIINVGKKFFDKTVSARIKCMYALDWLLLIAFMLIGLSGIMISHVIFKFGNMPVWRPLHSIVSAVSVILLGIHLGLHGGMILNAVKTKAKRSFAAIKITASIFLAILLCAGIYGDVVSKTQPVQNQITGRPRYETVLALFNRSVNLLSGPPEYVRNRMSGGGGNPAYTGGRGGGNEAAMESQRPHETININTILISVSNYMAFIILCAIIVYLIDGGIKKRIKKH